MAGPALEYTYRYPNPSALEWSGEGGRLSLATSEREAAPPLFFRGALVEPRRAADLLLALVRVVHSRFHVPPAMLHRILAQSDPVVTCAEDRLRFEGFSACCSAYGRVDLLPGAVAGMFLGHGTTNVDFNPPMRAALARIREREPVRLTVGKEVELEHAGGAVTERKVPLPVRWLKGFVESQAYLAAMSLRLDASGTEARRFLRTIPRQGTRGRSAWAVSSGGGLRLSQVPAKDGVRVSGVERLRLLEGIAHHARRLHVYATPDGQTSAWVLHCGDAVFQLVLSPEVWRGFSGEGQLLSDLVVEVAPADLARVRGALRWQSRLDPVRLARECGLDPESTRCALAKLAAAGLVGYDLAEGAYFHRELPFDLRLIDDLQPRLKDARKLAAEGGVRIENGSGETVAWVRGSGVEHRVRLGEQGSQCTCPWFAKHRGERGPCKHVLALQNILEETNDP